MRMLLFYIPPSFLKEGSEELFKKFFAEAFFSKKPEILRLSPEILRLLPEILRHTHFVTFSPAAMASRTVRLRRTSSERMPSRSSSGASRDWWCASNT